MPTESETCLTRAEAIDGYRARCQENSVNERARAGQTYELDEIDSHVLYFLKDAVEHLPLVQQCEIAILNSTADGGLPHTRPPNVICLPKSMCKAQPASASFKTTLLHEAIHVHQRMFEEEWGISLRRAGWRPVDAERIPEEFRNRCRINPDTLKSPFWAWNDYHVPLPLFRRTDTPTLSDAPPQWLDLRMNSLFHTAPNSIVKTYGAKIVQPEHPYEIYAELLSEAGVNTLSDLFVELSSI